MTNYYEVLGVSRDATENVIREKFRVLARESHPDRFTDPVRKQEAEKRFQLLTEAVNVLTNEQKRKAHDFDLTKGSDPGGHDPAAVAKVYLAKGVKSFKDADYLQAVQLFDMSVKHNPKDAKAHHYLALACMKVKGQTRRGVEAIEAALKLDSNNGVFYRDAGKLYHMAGINSKAERHLEEALKWLPDDAEAQRILGEIRVAAEPKSSGVRGFFGRKG